MSYTTSQIANLAGVTKRTIHFYERKGLLKASRNKANNYREFDQSQVDRLQQIMFYRALDFSIIQIGTILKKDQRDLLTILQAQKNNLLAKQEQVCQLLTLIDRSIANQTGEIKMTDAEKFVAFKQHALQNNEEQFGEEISQTYDPKIVKRANQQWQNMTQEQYQQM